MYFCQRSWRHKNGLALVTRERLLGLFSRVNRTGSRTDGRLNAKEESSKTRTDIHVSEDPLPWKDYTEQRNDLRHRASVEENLLRRTVPDSKENEEQLSKDNSEHLGRSL
ncbi:hypothetical protein R1flu_004641 [Riccia fluitans]|uniref:Uncharacterized protein n=1 Tax=Riccia fluitans TaxID=41844 RepID=A0ABD1YTY9_9MARC